MSEEARAVFSDDEILQQAQLNFDFLFLGTLAFLRECSQPPADYVASLGRLVAASWDALGGDRPAEVARGAALNMVSVGATLRSLSGDEASGEAVVDGWPPAEALEFFGATQQDADLLWDIFAPIAAHLGLRYRWQREGSAVRMTFSR